MTEKRIPYPKRFRAPMNDQGLFGGRFIGDMLIHCIISFDGQTDENRMAEAVKLSLDAEPILGCRFAAEGWRMYWERRTYPYIPGIFSFMKTENIEEEILRFLLTPSDPCKDPLVQVLLLRSESDSLCIKVSHVVADAGGVKDYAYLLASVYRNLADHPGYMPEPNLNGSRSMRQVSRQFDFTDKLRILRRTFRDLKSFAKPGGFSLPLIKGDNCDRTFIIRKIHSDLFRSVKDYGRRHSATINDVLLTAVFRAFFDIIEPDPKIPLRVVTTADLRRFLPAKKAGAICNLSGVFHLQLYREPEAAFEHSLSQICEQMNFIKNDFIGLGNHPIFVLPSLLFPPFLGLQLAEQMSRLLLRGDSYTPPGFTNMGVIDAKQLIFGGLNVTEAFLTAPVVFSPLLLIGLSGFRDAMTLSAGFCNAGANKAIVGQLLSRIEQELSALFVVPPSGGLRGNGFPA